MWFVKASKFFAGLRLLARCQFLIQYTGRENDGTGVYYYRARYYEPLLQRFISEDPIGFNGGDFNLYAYVTNNPNEYVDPWGLQRSGPRRSPQEPLVRPNPLGEGFEWGERGLSEMERRREQQSEWDNRVDLENEIRKRLSELDFECDTWVEVCWRLRDPKGTVRVYLKHRLRPSGIICQWRLVPGRNRNCCDANPG